ncbi:hypothetical protein AKI39_12320 [Bordetella sp. H567]|uniref:hypothetical protein n=1 Tax=Bordetella sp. H567 TaxID=1697043 RepID=UPI00081C3CAC|nr:hypothetical protein [Bordetella sp. H567]AOB31306.1 hypothetical protein AKI39_12320 [Bordetella sp. H567]
MSSHYKTRRGTDRLNALARAAAWSGSVASAASMAVLAYFGRRERKGMAPMNAPSHWLWREESLRERGFTVRHTVAGYLIHHGSSVFWAVPFEYLLLEGPHRPRRIAVLGLTLAAVAAGVDLKLTPKRLTPGFERHLDGSSLAIVYGVFGLALGAAHALRCEQCRSLRKGRHPGC